MVNRETVDFGPSTIGEVSSRTVVVNNCSANRVLAVSSIAMQAGGADALFVDASEFDSPLRVAPEESFSFPLFYAPVTEGSHTGTLEIRSNDVERPLLSVPVTAESTSNRCPLPVATASVRGSAPVSELDAEPLDTVVFDASGSSDPDGGVLSGYEWTVVDRPTDSSTQLVPSATTPRPELFLDLAGRYVVELRVIDDQGTPSCAVARVVITAASTEDIHIQLVWETAGDPNPNDTGFGAGSDLDLHLLHQSKMDARWNTTSFENPWDCNWQNREPVVGLWDPSLDIDDTGGRGPENINYNTPEDGDYGLGVYYFSDHGFGPSDATVRIFIEGTLVFESEATLDGTGRFWDVADIIWPGGEIEDVNTMYDDFP